MRIWLVLAFPVLLVAPRAACAQFVDATNGALVGVSASRVAWVDYDTDGDWDLTALSAGVSTRVFRNDAGTFAAGGTVGACCASGSQTWGDYDDDGAPDFYRVHGMYFDFPEPSRLFRNLGGGAFQDVSPVILQQPGAGQSAAWVDFDNDGDLDLSCFNRSISNRLYRNDGGGVFVDATSGAFGGSSSFYGAWGDYDNDGDVDLYLVNKTAPNKLLRNDGGGTFVDVTSGPLGGSTIAWHWAAAWGDYDNDGDLDLVLAVGGDQPQSKLYRNDGGGTFVDVTSLPLAGAKYRLGAAWGDYDNDGDLDLLMAGFPVMGNNIGSQLFRNEGGGSFVEVADAAINATYAQHAVWGDFDNDGDLDVFAANFGSPATLLRNDHSTGNHWLHLDLVGTSSSRDALGARIEVTTAGVTQIREISDSGGNSPTAEFGLGAAPVADAIVVRWPSGIVQLLTGVATNQRTTITEPVGTGALQPTSLRYSFHGNAPNPFNPSTTLAFDLPGAQPVSLVIYDARGRPVRTLIDGIMPAGRNLVSWDGRDGAGRCVASGVYISSLHAGGFQRSHRMTLLK